MGSHKYYHWVFLWVSLMPAQKTFRGVEGQVELIFLLMSSDAMPSKHEEAMHNIK